MNDGKATENPVRYPAPSKVSAEEVDALQRDVLQFLQLLGKQRTAQPFDDDIVQDLRKRVPPRMLGQFPDFASLAPLMAMEAADIGNRISRYQYIERYGLAMQTQDRRMALAFIEHAYALRTSEIYLIGERSEQVLRFIRNSLRLVGVSAPDEAKVFSKRYRAAFERRLRERHRMTHGHERPSLVSRITAVPPEQYETEVGRDALISVAMQSMSALEELMELLPEKERRPSPLNMVAFRTDYLLRVDQEAAQMWELFSAAVSGLLQSAGTVQVEDC